MSQPNEVKVAEGTSRAVPFIARVAGLTTAALEPLVSTRCAELCGRIEEQAALMAQLRSTAADRIFAVLTRADPSQRRFLLELKRDCFNGRSVARYERSPHWAEVQPWVEHLPERIAALEREQASLQEALGAAWREDRERARRFLAEQSRQKELLRALSLASPMLAEHLRRLSEKDAAQYGRRERKAEHSFLRYFTRAAVKLSPYSTFTKIGLGLMVDGTDAPGVRWQPGPWQERSLVRVKRYLLDQCRELLLRHPRVRERLSVVLNDTTEELSGGQHRFLRPMSLQLDEKSGDFQYSRPSIVKARLGGPLISWLKEQLTQRPRPYRELRAQAAAAFEQQPEALDGTLNKLVDVGLLSLVPPWPTYEIHLEQRLASFLRELGEDEALARVITTLEQLLALEQGYAQAEHPLRSVLQIDQLISQLFASIKAATQPESSLRFEKGTQNYYEDVLLQAPAGGSPAREVLHLERRDAEELLRTGSLLWRVAQLYEPRHDFHHTLWHAVARRWPGRSEFPVLEVFAELQPLWESYLAHLATSEGEAFDPYKLPEAQELARLRERMGKGLSELLTMVGDGETGIPLEKLQRLVGDIPTRYAPLVGTCLFLQPADPRGERWVVNRFFEGTGRFSSRFTAVLEGSMLDSFVSHSERAARLELDGEPAELVDLLATRGNTVSLHWPQTPRVLEIPGEYSHLPPERRLQLKDLVLRVDPERRLFTLRDAQGRRCIPTYLSSLQNEFVPSMLKFLDIFGPMARGGFRLPNHVRMMGQTRVSDRLVVGRLVVHRRRWVIPREEVPRWTGSDAELFQAVNRWRASLRIPEQIYIIEQVTADYVKVELFKPQYIDFRSPILVELFCTSCLAGEGPITIDEALPTPDAFPADSSGSRRGVELILDSNSAGIPGIY